MHQQIVEHCALLFSVWRSGIPYALPHHSDRRSQYTSKSLQRLLQDWRITCLMSRAGNVWDKSVVEGFLSTLKAQQKARCSFTTRDAARADIVDYIERFYNPVSRR